jgi:hypothetical protein
MGTTLADPISGSPVVPAPGAPDEGREARLASLLHAWWRDERPNWTEESWWEATLHEPVRRLLWLVPGPHLVNALAELAPGSPCPVDHRDDQVPGWPSPGRAPGWPCSCQVVTAAAWDACASWLSTRSAAALVTAAGPDPVSFDIAGDRQQIHDPAREELAHALRSTIPAMGNRIGHARALGQHPQLVALIASAAISSWAGRLVLDHVADLEPQDADAVIVEVCTRVHHRLATGRRPYHSAEVSRVARAARLRICPESDQQARIRAFAARRVTVHPRGNGMATLVADIADVEAHRIHRRLTALAAGLQADAAADGAAEPRTRDQLRADVMTDLLLGAHEAGRGVACGACPGAPSGTGPEDAHGAGAGAPSGTGPGVAQASVPHHGSETDAAPTHGRDAEPNEGPRPDIQVVVSLETLLGLVDDPAEVPGLGLVPPDVARELAGDGRWRAWVTDAAGSVTATGSRGYVPSTALARLIRAREPRCRFPGCHQPATRCDLDHAVPWPHGPTTPANLGPLCRRHHNLKTHTPWALDPAPPPNPAHRSAPFPLDPTHPRARARPLDPALAGPGSSDPVGTPPGWRWRTPAGLTIIDGPEPPLPTGRGAPQAP